MTAETQFATKRKTLILGSALLLAGLAFTGTASAVIVDGNLDANEYANSKQITWWNDHESVYTLNRAPLDNSWETSVTNTLRSEISNGGATLNLFFEVPDYARRMIWESGCEALSGGGTNGCSTKMTDTAEKEAVLDAYGAGTHHSSSNMDYGTQTGSEFFRLNYTGAEPISPEIHGDPKPKSEDGGPALVAISWQAEDTVNDNFTWKTSREYVIDLDANDDCNTTTCYRFDKTAAIELEWINLGSGVAASIVDSIANMQLHLSDEAHGIPGMSEVPVPAAFWLFGTALIGFIGYSRRTNLS